MQIIVTEQSQQDFSNLGAYHYFTMVCDKHEAVVCVAKGKGSYAGYVHVIVNNASHRAWKMMGKQFDTVEQALENYKTGAIKAMIRHAYDEAHKVAAV